MGIIQKIKELNVEEIKIRCKCGWVFEIKKGNNWIIDSIDDDECRYVCPKCKEEIEVKIDRLMLIWHNFIGIWNGGNRQCIKTSIF